MMPTSVRLTCLCAALCGACLAWAEPSPPAQRTAFVASAWPAAGEVAHISADQAQQVSTALARAGVVQNGLGNSVGSGSGAIVARDAGSLVVGAIPLAGLAGATVVQNSLNDQSIRTLTQIDAGVNSLGILHTINLLGILRDALIGAVGGH